MWKPTSQRRANASVGFSITELLVIAGILLLLFVLVLPVLRQNHAEVGQSHRTGIATTLTRIERAKAQFAADHQLKEGDPLTMNDLVKDGYLSKHEMDGATAMGVRYIVGAVGTPANYVFEGNHLAHPLQ